MILYDYIFHAKNSEKIAKTYPSLKLEQVYATILYYLQNQQAVDAYMTDWLQWGDRIRAEQQKNHRPIVVKLKHLYPVFESEEPVESHAQF